MTSEEIEDILLIGKFMEVENLFPYQYKDGTFIGVYIAEDDGGYIDYVDVGINFYSPHSNWNALMEVVDHIQKLGYLTSIYGLEFDDKRLRYDCILNDFSNNKIYSYSYISRKEAVYTAVINFIKWYNEQI